MYQNILEQLGLTKNETLVYQALLRLGQSSITPILKETKLKKGNTYNILYDLIDKKLVSKFDKNKKTYFQIEPPTNLQNLIQAKDKSIDQIKKSLTNALPSLISDFIASSNRPATSYLEGKEGLEKIYEDILKEKKNLLIFASTIDRDMPEFNKLIDRQIKKQINANIKVKSLVRGEIINKKYAEKLKPLGIQTRGLANYHPTSQIIIYGNKVAITSFKKDLMSTLIENESIANSLKNIFEITWKNAKSL